MATPTTEKLANKIKHTFYDVAQEVVREIRSERESKSHQMLRAAPGNANRADAVDHDMHTHGIEHPASTGVIYVMDRAMANGFTYGDDSWANFGQGAPEVGHIEGCRDKPSSIALPLDALEYAPTAGIKPLREAVANLYNDLYRKDKVSKYTYENICIVPGGRAGLTRVAAAVGDINVGYFLPEYTAYEQMLGVFRRFCPIPTTLDEESKYHIDTATIRKEITGRGLGLVVASNPRNPTGQVIEDGELRDLVALAKERHTTLVMDEFYSAYIYSHDEAENGRMVSTYVNADPVIIIDGLTKNFRLPGWRICWIVGPKDVISSMQSCGSFLEGGANHPLQLAAIPLVNAAVYKEEAKHLQIHFRAKRDYVLRRLEEIGFNIKVKPVATFYIWLDLKQLKAPVDVGLNFFEECLKEKVILVPGIFFDINVSSIYGTEDRIVLDIGSLYIKCGLSGEPRPRHIIPVYAQTGFSKEKHGAMHSVEGQCKELYTTSLFLPDPWEDDDFSGIHETTYTTDTVTAMSAMESVESPTASHADIQFSRIETQLSQLLRSIYFDYLLTDPKSRKVTICESPLLPVQLKQLIAKILFQHFHAPSISFAPIHFLAILSTGRTTGLVVDVGNLETIVLPVYLSRPLFPYIKTSLLAGKAFTLSLRRLLLSFGRIIPDSSLHSELATQYPLTPSILTRNLLEDIKVRLCIVSPLMAADKSIMRDLNEVQIHQTYADLSTATNIRLQITVKEDVLYDDQKILSIGD
ncbi:hypothetical protein BZG36_04674, partial [Bifiguratus adelaidae]